MLFVLKALEARKDARKAQLERRRMQRLEKRKGGQRQEDAPSSRDTVHTLDCFQRI